MLPHTKDTVAPETGSVHNGPPSFCLGLERRPHECSAKDSYQPTARWKSARHLNSPRESYRDESFLTPALTLRLAETAETLIISTCSALTRSRQGLHR